MFLCLWEHVNLCGSLLSAHNLCWLHVSVCVCVYVRISGCQLQFCGPEENTADSLRVLLVPLSYRCVLGCNCDSVNVCTCVCPSLTGNKNSSFKAQRS